jgi:hypothetical protein
MRALKEAVGGTKDAKKKKGSRGIKETRLLLLISLIVDVHALKAS